MWDLEELKRMYQPSAGTRAGWGNEELNELFEQEEPVITEEDVQEWEAELCPHGIPWDEIEAEPMNCIECLNDQYEEWWEYNGPV